MAKNSFYTRDKQEVKAITDQLEEGLKELFAKEKYKSYLSMMSKFHNYCANNIQLITMQCPDATFVAGYKAWQNDYNRHVKRYEEGIRILAPAPYTVKKERDKAGAHGLRRLPTREQRKLGSTTLMSGTSPIPMRSST